MSLVTRGLGEPQALVTRGLAGAFVGAPPLTGGVVVAEATALLTDVGVLEELVTAVETALAPVLEELLTEEGLEISVSAAATLDLSCVDAAVTSMALTEEALTISPDEAATLHANVAENLTLDVGVGEGDVVETETTVASPTNLITDEDNAGA